MREAEASSCKIDLPLVSNRAHRTSRKFATPHERVIHRQTRAPLERGAGSARVIVLALVVHSFRRWLPIRRPRWWDGSVRGFGRGVPSAWATREAMLHPHAVETRSKAFAFSSKGLPKYYDYRNWTAMTFILRERAMGNFV